MIWMMTIVASSTSSAITYSGGITHETSYILASSPLCDGR